MFVFTDTPIEESTTPKMRVENFLGRIVTRIDEKEKEKLCQLFESLDWFEQESLTGLYERDFQEIVEVHSGEVELIWQLAKVPLEKRTSVIDRSKPLRENTSVGVQIGRILSIVNECDEAKHDAHLVDLSLRFGKHFPPEFFKESKTPDISYIVGRYPSNYLDALYNRPGGFKENFLALEATLDSQVIPSLAYKSLSKAPKEEWEDILEKSLDFINRSKGYLSHPTEILEILANTSTSEREEAIQLTLTLIEQFDSREEKELLRAVVNTPQRDRRSVIEYAQSISRGFYSLDKLIITIGKISFDLRERVLTESKRLFREDMNNDDLNGIIEGVTNYSYDLIDRVLLLTTDEDSGHVCQNILAILGEMPKEEIDDFVTLSLNLLDKYPHKQSSIDKQSFLEIFAKVSVEKRGAAAEECLRAPFQSPLLFFMFNKFLIPSGSSSKV